MFYFKSNLDIRTIMIFNAEIYPRIVQLGITKLLLLCKKTTETGEN
jgi:hypothetical protein